ncbi:unnamed protein product [Penicillium manginii]
MSLIDNILHAASVISTNLSTVDPQDLLPHHRCGLQSAFQILEQTLSSPSLHPRQHDEHASLNSMPCPPEAPAPSYPGVCLPTSESQRQHDDSHVPIVQTLNISGPEVTPSNQNGVNQQLQQSPKEQDEVSSFMEILQRGSKKIHAFAKRDVGEALSRDSNWTEQDPRLVDIDLSERHTSTTRKFRGWLGRYSLAEDYLAWVQSTYKRPRNSFLNLNEKDADKKGQGHIAEYLSLVDLPKGKSHKAIRIGLKYISFEQVYDNPGVSVLLCHLFTAFRDFPYSQFRSLADAIQRSEEWSNLARTKADWICQCRSIYNGDSGRSNAVSRKTGAYLFQVRYQAKAQLLNRKRPLEVDLTTEESQNKRKVTTNVPPTIFDTSSNNATSISRPKDTDSSQTATDGNDEGQQPRAVENLCPNFDPWEDLNMFEGFDLWQEDFAPIEHTLLSFASEEGLGAEPTENVSVEPRDAALETNPAFHANNCAAY